MTTLPVTASRLAAATPDIRPITFEDLKTALRAGVGDFLAMPTHVVFISLLYPIIGAILAMVLFDNDLIPLLFPLASGFALLGPFAAVGLYELSRRRGLGLDTSWSHALDAIDRRSALSMLAVGGVLLTIFLSWLLCAAFIYAALYGAQAPQSLAGFARDVLTTPRGWALILVGNLAGCAFSLLALAVSIVSIPMIVDRHVDALTAIETSLAAFRRNPAPLMAWGFIVAGLLVLGMLPLFVGLAVAMPILGHASWHLYRRLVVA